MSDDFEDAENFSQTRAKMAPFLGLLVLIAQQGIMFSWDWGANSVVQVAVWLLFAIVMLLLLLTGGGWFLSRRARTLANDELTRMNRARAVQIGFIVAMVTGFIVVAVAPFEPLPAQRAAHIIISMSLGCAFLAFGVAEASTNG